MKKLNEPVRAGDPQQGGQGQHELVERVLSEARRLGVGAAETTVTRSGGLSASVRMGALETVEHTRDKSLVVSVYLDNRVGAASTSDFTAAAVTDTVRAACAIARHTGADPCNGLADPARLATQVPDLDLYHPWALDVDRAVELAMTCEDAARASDARITNSEGATVASSERDKVYGNTNGFVGRVRSTRHTISCAVVGRGESGMQRDYWYTAARKADELEAPEQVGRIAARRTLRRLDARRLKTRQAPVLYEAPVAASLLRHLVSAISGSSVYRGASFLVDHVGKAIFPANVRIHEQPHLPRAMGSAAFDGEGVATAARDVVADGVLQGYVLDSYSARKLGLETTGNAGGVHNLTIEPGGKDFRELLAAMDTGLLVTELIGFGVNNVTGDYSRGAAGFWVEGGELRHPVQEITVAGNLREMFRGLVESGTDVDVRGGTRTGSLLVDGLTIAGA